MINIKIFSIQHCECLRGKTQTTPKGRTPDPKLMSEPTISLFRIRFGFTCTSRKINTAKIENDILLNNNKL